jgi:hypothetical protein
MKKIIVPMFADLLYFHQDSLPSLAPWWGGSLFTASQRFCSKSHNKSPQTDNVWCFSFYSSSAAFAGCELMTRSALRRCFIVITSEYQAGFLSICAFAVSYFPCL